MQRFDIIFICRYMTYVAAVNHDSMGVSWKISLIPNHCKLTSQSSFSVRIQIYKQRFSLNYHFLFRSQNDV